MRDQTVDGSHRRRRMLPDERGLMSAGAMAADALVMAADELVMAVELLEGEGPSSRGNLALTAARVRPRDPLQLLRPQKQSPRAMEGAMEAIAGVGTAVADLRVERNGDAGTAHAVGGDPMGEPGWEEDERPVGQGERQIMPLPPPIERVLTLPEHEIANLAEWPTENEAGRAPARVTRPRVDAKHARHVRARVHVRLVEVRTAVHVGPRLKPQAKRWRAARLASRAPEAADVRLHMDSYERCQRAHGRRVQQVP